MSEMMYITLLLVNEQEKLAGPLLAYTYAILLNGCNAWYTQKLAKGKLSLEMEVVSKAEGLFRLVLLF
jgi:hypothetical protein